MTPLVGLVSLELPVEILVIGLIAGLTYALLGIGLALVYKASRVINFAHGEMGALPALLVAILVLNYGWNYWLAIVVAIVVAIAIGVAVEGLVIRRLRNVSRLTVLVATIGVGQVLFVIGLLLPKGGGFGAATYPTPFDLTVTIGSLRLGAAQLLTLLVVPAITLGLSMFFKHGRIGRASRAAAENTEAAQAAGVPVHRVSQSVWVIAALLALVSVMLVAPTRPITAQAEMGPPLMVRALGAAMLGGLTKLPRVFVGGVVIGVIEAVALWNYPTGGTLEVVLFAVILVSLLAQRRLGELARGGEESSWSLAGTIKPLGRRALADPRVRVMCRAAVAASLVIAVVLPVFLSTSQRFFMGGVVVFGLMGLSLVVLTGFAGQISLGQFAFVGLGAAVAGRMLQIGHPFLVAGLFAAIAGTLVALLVGLPALRIRGLFLAITTLAFAVATASWLFDQSWLVRSDARGTSLQISRPEFLGIDFENELAYYWLCLAVLVGVAALVYRFRSTGVGRRVLAVRDNEPGASSFAIAPRSAKLLAFAVSGTIAALGGFLYGGLLVNFSSDVGNTFGAAESVALVAFVIFGGVTTITGALLGAVWVRGLPHLLGADLGLLSSGMGLLLVLLIVPGGLASLVFSARDRIVDRLLGSNGGAGDGEPASPARAKTSLPASGARGRAGTGEAGGVSIGADRVSVSFGGKQALADVSVTAAGGEVVGLMGPNGAGKTTLFDVLSGQLRPSAGAVSLNGEPVTELPSHERAKLGLGRTFQQARLFPGMTVAECLMVSMERARPSQTMATLVGLPAARVEERTKRRRAGELAEFFDLQEYLDQPVSELSTGLRRATELACVVGMGSRVLLLDEPTAGFSRQETEAFEPLLRSVRDELDATVIVVDHDVALMSRLVDRLYVLVAGELVASGDPGILSTNDQVLAAYFGERRGTGRRRRRRRRTPSTTNRQPRRAIAATRERPMERKST